MSNFSRYVIFCADIECNFTPVPVNLSLAAAIAFFEGSIPSNCEFGYTLTNFLNRSPVPHPTSRKLQPLLSNLFAVKLRSMHLRNDRWSHSVALSIASKL